MENNEVLLAKLQEQLLTAIEGHRQITIDLRTIFNRIDEDGKTIVRLDSEMKSVAEKATMRKENIDIVLANLIKTDGDLKKSFEDFQSKMEEQESARKDFEVDMKATFKTVSWVFGGLSILATILATLFGIMTYVRGH